MDPHPILPVLNHQLMALIQYHPHPHHLSNLIQLLTVLRWLQIDPMCSLQNVRHPLSGKEPEPNPPQSKLHGSSSRPGLATRSVWRVKKPASKNLAVIKICQKMLGGQSLTLQKHIIKPVLLFGKYVSTSLSFYGPP